MNESVETRIRALSFDISVTKVRSIKDIESFGKNFKEVRVYIDKDTFDARTIKDKYGAHLVIVTARSNLATVDFEVPA